jgi:hypothetical protein
MTRDLGLFATAMSAGYSLDQRFAANRAGGAVWVNEWMSSVTNDKKSHGEDSSVLRECFDLYRKCVSARDGRG